MGERSDSVSSPKAGSGRAQWTAELIERELGRVFEQLGAEQWPSQREMRTVGHPGLSGAVARHGGPDVWSARMQVEVKAARQPHQAMPDGQIERYLRQLAAECGGRMPTLVEIADGPVGLAGAVRRTGGARVWAKRLGLPLARPGRPRRRDEDLAADVRAFLAGADVMPSKRQFQAAGRLGLWMGMHRRGGVAAWASRLGLQTGGAR